MKLEIDYEIEGSDLGYRWNARTGKQALFPFGFGLSYTSFALSGLSADRGHARFTMRNTGDLAGADVAQLYLLEVDGSPRQRLVGFAKRTLAPGESQQVELEIDPRLLAEWEDGDWVIAPGTYSFGLATDAQTIVERKDVQIAGERWSGSVAAR